MASIQYPKPEDWQNAYLLVRDRAMKDALTRCERLFGRQVSHELQVDARTDLRSGLLPLSTMVERKPSLKNRHRWNKE